MPKFSIPDLISDHMLIKLLHISRQIHRILFLHIKTLFQLYFVQHSHTHCRSYLSFFLSFFLWGWESRLQLQPPSTSPSCSALLQSGVLRVHLTSMKPHSLKLSISTPAGWAEKASRTGFCSERPRPLIKWKAWPTKTVVGPAFGTSLLRTPVLINHYDIFILLLISCLFSLHFSCF